MTEVYFGKNQNQMERVKSTDLMGANAYFTNFDNRIVADTTDKKGLQRSVERTLKVLLLTKNNVVCAASHLTNGVAFSLLSDHRVLLDQQLIIPAFRDDKTEFAQLFTDKGFKAKDKKMQIDFYQNSVQKTVSWDLVTNSNWFRDTVIKGLDTRGSVIRKNLKALSNKQIEELIAEINRKDILDRGTIEFLSRDFDPETQLILKNYRELVYHMSGARVVNSESTLPQENYIDYSLADLHSRQIQLSELQVFWKIFIELLYETLNKPKISVDLLDILSFEDISKIREPILESGFVESYNNFYKIAATTVGRKNENEILFDLNELMKIKSIMENSFKAVFEKELGGYFKKKALKSGTGLVKNTVNMGLGFVPMSNLISGALGIFNEFKSTQFNVLQTFNNVRSLRDYDQYVNGKQQQILHTIKTFDIAEKTMLTDVIELITSTIAQKIQM